MSVRHRCNLGVNKQVEASEASASSSVSVLASQPLYNPMPSYEPALPRSASSSAQDAPPGVLSLRTGLSGGASEIILFIFHLFHDLISISYYFKIVAKTIYNYTIN